jgi:hypothetical protein
MPDGFAVAQDPLGFGRLAAQNLANRQLDIREQEAMRRNQLLDLQIGQARQQEQSRLGEIQRQQRMEEGLSQALANIPEGGNRFTATHDFLVKSGFRQEANDLISNQLAQIEQIEKIDPAAADKAFNQSVGLAQGLRAKTTFDDKLGKLLNLTNEATGETKTFRETPGTPATANSPKDLTLLEGFTLPGEVKKEDLFKQETTLRKDFVAQSGEFIKSRDSLGRVRAAADDPSAAGDLALIFNFMKVLDPGSVVREGEFATAQNAAGVPTRIVNVYNRVLRGERLSDTQRKDFTGRAEKLFKPIEKTHERREKQFRGLAKRNKLDPENIVLDLSIQELGQSEELAPPAPESQQSTTGFKVIGIREG